LRSTLVGVLEGREEGFVASGSLVAESPIVPFLR